ncbi:hypothetical protein P7C70_g3839, partial [Phenoliferia sp. Uapishka_3]
MSDSETAPAQEKVATSSVPPVSKAINKPFQVQQKWKAEQAAKAAKAESQPKGKKAEKGRSFGMKLFLFTVFSILSSIFLSRTVTETWLWGYEGKYSNPAKIYHDFFPPKERFFSETELRKYDGTSADLPVYVAIDGDVYDVSLGRASYSPGGGYSFFSGVDAARAYVTGCFKTHLTHDIRGFGKKEIRSLDQWKNFFKNHAKYTYVGKVVHAPIDPDSPLPEPCDGHGK